MPTATHRIRGEQDATAEIPRIGPDVRHLQAVPDPPDETPTPEHRPPAHRLPTLTKVLIIVLAILGVSGLVVSAVTAIVVNTNADTLPEVMRAGGFTCVTIAAVAGLFFTAAALSVWAVTVSQARQAEETAAQQRRGMAVAERLSGTVADLRRDVGGLAGRLAVADVRMARTGDDVEEIRRLLEVAGQQSWWLGYAQGTRDGTADGALVHIPRHR